jgi:hypothetical protein
MLFRKTNEAEGLTVAKPAFSNEQPRVSQTTQKTLVIHPFDPTTDSLCEVYRGLDAEVIRDTRDEEFIFNKIREADRAIFLGHGTPFGLIGTDYKLCVDHRHVELLRTKRSLVAIWCYAASFFEDHGLTGFACDMFISEPKEAEMLRVDYTDGDELEAGNIRFASSVGRSVALWESPEETAMRALKDYDGDTPVIRYNRAGLGSFKDGICTYNDLSKGVNPNE